MQDEKGNEITALNYVSVLNSSPIPYTSGLNQITVTLQWWVYAGSPGEGLKRHFNVNDPERKGAPKELASCYYIGWDHYSHNWWAKQKPQIELQAVANGQLSGTVQWNWKNYEHSFNLPNTELTTGPQRKGQRPWLPPRPEDRISIKWWQYDRTAKRWVSKYAG